VNLWQREITVRGKSGQRIVRIGHEAARALDRYLRVRARHAQAHRPELWLGCNYRGPMTAQRDLPDGDPSREAVRGGCVAAPVPAPFQPYLAGSRGSGGRLDGAERLVLPADAAPLRRQRPQRPSPPQLQLHHGHTLNRPHCESIELGRLVLYNAVPSNRDSGI
jgi:hypothetical protein